MKWKPILQLSVFGLIMACGTISLIPEKFEFIFWIVIFILVAYVLAKACTGKYFAQGFMVSLFNSIYLTAAHIIFYKTYKAHHPAASQMIPAGANILGYMIGIGIASGLGFGLLQGLFAFIASKLVKPNTI